MRKHLVVIAQAASSPKCSRWEKKRGEDGVAVKDIFNINVSIKLLVVIAQAAKALTLPGSAK